MLTPNPEPPMLSTTQPLALDALPLTARDAPLLERLRAMAPRFRRHAARQNDGSIEGARMWAWLMEAGALCEMAADAMDHDHADSGAATTEGE